MNGLILQRGLGAILYPVSGARGGQGLGKAGHTLGSMLRDWPWAVTIPLATGSALCHLDVKYVNHLNLCMIISPFSGILYAVVAFK